LKRNKNRLSKKVSAVGKKYKLMKLDEDDILEIVIEYFQRKEKFGCLQARACLMGEVGKDLRFIGVFSDEEEKIQCDFKKIDMEMEYNGDHSLIKNKPEFWI